MHNLHDIIDKAHVEHTIGLIEHEETAAREVEVAHLEMAEQTPWGGNEHIGTQTHAAHLLVVAPAVVAAIDGYGRYIVEVITKALHGLVDLLGEFTGGRHDDAVDGILGELLVVELREDGQQIGGGLASTRLGHTQHVVAVEDLWDTAFLNGRHLFEAHIVERIEDIVVEICFFKFH